MSGAVERAFKDCKRSILRGIAKAAPKTAFTLEQVPFSNAWDSVTMSQCLPRTWHLAEQSQAVDPFAMTVAGSWFLRREIELAAAKVRDVKVNDEFRAVTWTLPATKTDTAANL